jgi:TnpA family transposase
LLQYINNVELRRTIQAATCKSEEFNGFLDWVTFGGDSMIKDNDRNNQKKIIKYAHLVANMVSLHVMANMTMVVNDMRNEGIKITDEILNKHSPFRTDHINRLGVFSLSETRENMPLEYVLAKICA